MVNIMGMWIDIEDAPSLSDLPDLSRVERVTEINPNDPWYTAVVVIDWEVEVPF